MIMRHYRSIVLNENTLLGCLFLLYFCGSIFSAVVFRLFGREMISILYTICFLTLYILYIPYYPKGVAVSLILFSIVSFLFLFTYFIHPEYSSWFSHQTYGFVPAILSPGSAVWAFVIIWLVRDEERLFRFLKISCWCALLFYSLQFLAAIHRGYWEYLDVDNVTIIRRAYSLEFGYNMLMPISFMGACAFLKGNKKYYIPWAAGVLMVLIGGSRGPVLWIVMMFPLMVLFRWKRMSSYKRLFFIIAMIIAVLMVLLVVTNKEAFFNFINSLLEKAGFSSRTLSSVADGSISDANGRDDIYKMALELIRTGGPFGWGIYGDRYVIGRKYKWGYSHNLFLELFVSFGYLGGAILCLLLLIGTIKLFRSCTNLNRQVVFVTFFTMAMKLMLSNSFWYTDAFWALLALMFLWKKSDLAIQRKQNSILSFATVYQISNQNG